MLKSKIYLFTNYRNYAAIARARHITDAWEKVNKQACSLPSRSLEPKGKISKKTGNDNRML